LSPLPHLSVEQDHLAIVRPKLILVPFTPNPSISSLNARTRTSDSLYHPHLIYDRNYDTSLQEIYLSLRPPASPDPALNPRLSAILAKAREVGYPKSNVDTAMNKVRHR